MKHLLLTTALVSLIAAAPLSAQTTDATGTGTDAGTMFTPPEGYTAYESATLTVEDMQGATVYDANGESVGEISDFVFAGGGSSATATGTTAGGAMDGTAGTGTGMTGTDTTAMTDGTGATTDTGTDAGTDMAGTDGVVDDGTAGTGDGTATSESMAETATDGTGTGNATDTTAGTGAGTETDMATDTDAGTDMTDTAGTDMAATESQQEVDVTSGEISHVVLDVGGFLGIGTHTVAVPLDELQVFRDEGSNLRIYLPWTQAQLEALPEFDENNPASLDATEQAPATGGGETGSGG